MASARNNTRNNSVVVVNSNYSEYHKDHTKAVRIDFIISRKFEDQGMFFKYSISLVPWCDCEIEVIPLKFKEKLYPSTYFQTGDRDITSVFNDIADDAAEFFSKICGEIRLREVNGKQCLFVELLKLDTSFVRHNPLYKTI